MQTEVTTHIMQVGKPMKKQTITYVLYIYGACGARHWSESVYFPTQKSATDYIVELKSFTTRRPDEHYKLIKRETIETEIKTT